MGWKHRRRRGQRGRFPKPVKLGRALTIEKLIPVPAGNTEPLYIEPAEVEAFRLVDLEGLSQEEAGEKMEVSRGTIWRLIQSARKKTAQALSEGRPIHITSSIAEDASPLQQGE